MLRSATGHGPVTVAVLADPLRSQLVLRDDSGVVEVLPVRPDVLPRVRQVLHDGAPAGRSQVELRDDDGTVRDRWGTFDSAAAATAVGITLLAADREADHAVVLDDDGGELLELRGNVLPVRR